MNDIEKNFATRGRSAKHVLQMAAAMAAVMTSPAQAAFNSGSTGADGALNASVNTEISLPPSGVLNYTTVNIATGVTVTFKKNATNTPVYILASGNVAIAGTIDIRGAHATASGTYGDGALGDDGLPGAGGPGGYEGGRGGRSDAALGAALVRGGAGLGPGGGDGGLDGGDGCTASGYYKYMGTGGAYASAVYQPFSVYNCGAAAVTKFAAPYGSPLLQPLLGGSGGGGGRGGTTYAGSGGGGGGGGILIAASGSIQITGTINARGGDGGGVSGTGAGGPGSGGSGGAIRLVGTSVAGSGSLLTDGGCANGKRESCGSDGSYNQYGGSPGRIRLEGETITFSGTSSPAYSADVPGPVFIAEAPSLRISSIASQAVPANPTGNADVTLPASTTGPVAVVFTTTNVPVGNTVKLRIAPAYGAASEALSPAIGGTAASGTTQVSVVLPAGPSTLQATTSYTVVVAGTLDLSRFAKNETVEKVEVTVALAGETRARVITTTGKAYDVSYAELRAAGFRG